MIIAFDVTDPRSFDNINEWIEATNQYANEKIPKILVGNKCDLSDKREITKE